MFSWGEGGSKNGRPKSWAPKDGLFLQVLFGKSDGGGEISCYSVGVHITHTLAHTGENASADLGPLTTQHPVSPILRWKNVLATLQLLAKSIWHPKSKVACTHRGKAKVYGMDTDAGISERFKNDHPSVASSRLRRCCCAPPHPRLRLWPGREGARYRQPFPLP